MNNFSYRLTLIIIACSISSNSFAHTGGVPTIPCYSSHGKMESKEITKCPEVQRSINKQAKKEKKNSDIYKNKTKK